MHEQKQWVIETRPGLSKPQAVAVRLVRDPEFTAYMKQMAIAALEAGPGTQAFADYFDIFSSTPGELAHLGPGPAPQACTCQSNTLITLSSIYTPISTCCGATATTTTSGGE